MLRGSTQGTGDDGVETRRLKKPGNPHDPHDGVEGARVEEVETAVSEAYRGIKEGPGEVIDEENQPGIPDEPHSEPQVESGVPTGVEVEPGGETDVERDRSAAHEDADATPVKTGSGPVGPERTACGTGYLRVMRCQK